MDSLRRDVALALRGFAKHPGFTLVVVLTLGLGIGANTAVFSVVDGVLLRPLPYAAPDRLAVVWTELPGQGRFDAHASGRDLVALEREAPSLAHVGAVWARPGVLRGDGGPVEEVEVGWVTPGFLDALGVAPLLGRLPTRDEIDTEKPEVIVLSHALWQRRYGGDPGILGRRVDFDDERWTVIGVMPAGFRMLFPPDQGVPEQLAAWLPWGSGLEEMSRAFRVFTPVARLADGVSLEQAAAQLRALAEREREATTDYASSGFGLRLDPLADAAFADVRPALRLLLGLVGLVFLIACANVASLMLARASDAEHELAVRVALGARRARLLRAQLTESLLLGALGGAVGIAFAGAALGALRALEPGRLPRVQDVGLDARALAFAAGAVLLAALLIGSLAAAQALRRVGPTALHAGGRSVSSHTPIARRLLVAGQVGLSVTLLVAAGLLLRSFERLSAVDPGFDPSGVLTFRLSLPDVHYRYADQGPKIAAFYRRLDERLAALPGVEAVGATLNPPLSGVPLRGRPYAYRTAEVEVEWGTLAAAYRTVTPGWLHAAGAHLVAGRFLDARDDRDHPLAVVVDTRLARKAWPDADPVGQPIRVELFRDGRMGSAWGEVVGVVQPVRLNDLVAPEGEQIYLAHAQAPQRTMYPTLRIAGDPLALLPAIQAEVEALEKDLPIFDVHLATEHVAGATAVTRFALASLAGFALLALVLSTAGVYAVMAYSVGRRRREIGIRLALGAAPRRIRALVVRQGLGMTAAGIAAGLVGALALGRALSGLLFGVTPSDPPTFAAVSLLLAATALAACWLPARRAARVPPTEALRSE